MTADSVWSKKKVTRESGITAGIKVVTAARLSFWRRRFVTLLFKLDSRRMPETYTVLEISRLGCNLGCPSGHSDRRILLGY